MRTWVSAMLGLGWALAGCGGNDATTEAAGGGGGSTTATGAGGSGRGGSGAGGSATGGAGQGGATTGSGGLGAGGAGSGGGLASALVVNEISAAGADWIELANAGATTIDLGDYALCDSDASGLCKVADAVRFPKGTLVAAHERVIVACDKSADAGVGPGSDCIPGGPSTCFYATWKVSASKGEKVFVLGAGDQVVGEAEYPKDAVPDGQSWGRLPDFIGGFSANAPTPGSANGGP